MSKDKVAAMALRLSAKDRADLAADLLLSLEESADENAEQLWFEEAERRITLYEQGKLKTRSNQAVFKRARARLR